MKKSKRRQAEARTVVAVAPAPRKFVWWPWAAALAALLLGFEVYSPALNGTFVFDDPYFPFLTPGVQHQPVWNWITGLRPLLMFSFWLNYAASGEQPFPYHATNVFLHLLNSVLVALIAIRLLELAGLKHGPAKPTLGIFAGALFPLHPMQTESVAHVASRSEVLSVFFYYGVYCVFLYRRTERVTLWRAFAVLALFGAAASTKEHTLTLPILLLLTDPYWIKGGVRNNALLYGLLAIAVVEGGAFVWRVLRAGDTAGFRVPGLPRFATYIRRAAYSGRTSGCWRSRSGKMWIPTFPFRKPRSITARSSDCWPLPRFSSQPGSSASAGPWPLSFSYFYRHLPSSRSKILWRSTASIFPSSASLWSPSNSCGGCNFGKGS